MKWSNVLHWISAISAVIGVLFFLAALFNVSLLGLSRSNLFNDAPTFLLISIAFGVGTILHMKLEKK